MKRILFVLCGAILIFASVARAAKAARPNFIFIFADDQRYDAMGVVQREQGERGRFPWFKTPNMDRLATEGVRFRNAFATSSLCSPSRAAFLSGRYNHFNGVADNHTPFPTNSVTYATVLRAGGYHTAYIGKWHMGRQRGQRPGFDFSASYIAHGRYQDCPFEFNGIPKPTSGWVDDVSTDLAIDYLRTNKAGPFLLVVGFKSPHDPRTPPERWKNAFAGDQAKPSVNKNSRPAYLTDGGKIPLEPAKNPGGEHLLNYFRCIAAEDENLGRILNALDELGLTENTMVVYGSDNGYYLGDHGLNDKRSAYDESMRIPLLLRYPKLGRKGVTVDESVLNIDLAPTFIQYAGLDVPAAMQGRGWRPLLERPAGGAAPDWRHAWFYEYFYELNFAVPTLFAVRTDTAKLVKYKDREHWTELFDLARDPYEMKNLANDPGADELRAKLDREFEKQKEAAAYVWPAYSTDEATERTRSMLAKPSETWVLDFRFDKDAGDTVTDASGKNNNGSADGVSLVAGRDGKKARQFDGIHCIKVPRSASLNPAVESWTVEAIFKPDSSDAVILAQGGDNFGYCLSIEEGAPVFSVAGQKRITRVAAKEKAGNAWTTVRASIIPEAITISVNDGPPMREPLQAPLSKNPTEGLQIGNDLGTTVLGSKKLPPFKGLIESVRIYSGDLGAAKSP